MILLGAKLRIPDHVFDACSPHHARGSSRHRELVDRRDDCCRNACALDFLCDRCTATITCPSGGDEETGVHLGGDELGGDLLSHAPGLGDRGAYAG